MFKWIKKLVSTKPVMEADKEQNTLRRLLEETKGMEPVERIRKVVVQDENFLCIPSLPIEIHEEGSERREPVLDYCRGVAADLLLVAKTFDEYCAGLSANQIGYRDPVFVVKIDDSYKLFINAEVVGVNGGRRTCQEFCLSRIGRGPVRAKRFKEVYVKYFDLEDLEWKTEWFRNHFVAQVIQHEIDHSHGKLV